MSMPINHQEIVGSALNIEDQWDEYPEYPIEPANNAVAKSSSQALATQEKLDQDIQSITAEIVSAGIKYTLATILPAFVLKLCSKVFGADILPDADHYATRINQQSSLLAGRYAEKYLSQLEGQNQAFFNKTGEEVVSMGGQFLAGYVGAQGWGEINKLADFYLDQLLGKGLMGFVAKPLASRVVGKLEKDFEKRWNVEAGKQSDYLANFAVNSRDSLLNLIEQFDTSALVQAGPDGVVDPQAQKEKVEFFNSLKGAAREFIQSDTFTQFVVGMIGKGLVSERQSLLRQFIEAYMPNFDSQTDDKGNIVLPKQIQSFVGNVVGQLNIQAGIEADQALTGLQNVDFVKEITDLAKKFLKGYLEQSKWDYVDGMVNSLVSVRAKEEQELIKAIWKGLKPDIEEYISTDAPSENNTVPQVFSVMKDILGGYIRQSGWDGIERYLGLGEKNNPASDTAILAQKETQAPLSLLVKRANQRGWSQAKGLIEAFLGVDQPKSDGLQNPNQLQAKLTGKVANLLGSILKKPGVEEAINQYVVGESKEEAVSSLSSKGSTMAISNGLKVVVKGLQLMASEESQGWNYTAVTNWLAKGALVKGGESVGVVLSTYLAGQGFTTLDEYVENILSNKRLQLLIKMAESGNVSQEQTDALVELDVSQKLTRDVWKSIKSQLVDEVFGSQAEFEKAHAANKESAESVMLDEVLRKSVLGLASTRELSTIGYTTKATTAAAKVSLKVAKVAATKVGGMVITAGKGTLNLTGRVVGGTINATSVSLNYVAGTIWNWWGGNAKVENAQDAVKENLE